MRRSVLSLVAALLACLGTVGLSSPVRAECPYSVVPPATDAARFAREVIVGTVVENVGGQLYDFRLRIDHVLRGSAEVGEIRRFEFLYPGWPLADVGDGTKMAPCEPIPGWNGNVIALSLDALAPDGKTRYNAASWISGDLPINHDLPRTTLAEMTSIAAMPQTDSARRQRRPGVAICPAWQLSWRWRSPCSALSAWMRGDGARHHPHSAAAEHQEQPPARDHAQDDGSSHDHGHERAGNRHERASSSAMIDDFPVSNSSGVNRPRSRMSPRRSRRSSSAWVPSWKSPGGPASSDAAARASGSPAWWRRP